MRNRQLIFMVSSLIIFQLTCLNVKADDMLEKNVLDIKTERLEQNQTEQKTEKINQNDESLFNNNETIKRQETLQFTREKIAETKAALFTQNYVRPEQTLEKSLFSDKKQAVVATNSSSYPTETPVPLGLFAAGGLAVIAGGLATIYFTRKEETE